MYWNLILIIFLHENFDTVVKILFLTIWFAEQDLLFVIHRLKGTVEPPVPFS